MLDITSMVNPKDKKIEGHCIGHLDSFLFAISDTAILSQIINKHNGNFNATIIVNYEVLIHQDLLSEYEDFLDNIYPWDRTKSLANKGHAKLRGKTNLNMYKKCR